MESRTIILKQDARGRVRTPVERREALVAEFERSGLSAMRFAMLAGVRYSTFWTWLKIRKGDRPSKAAQAAGKAKFVEVVMPVPPAPKEPFALLVTLPGGATLSLTEPAQVRLAAQVLKALA